MRKYIKIIHKILTDRILLPWMLLLMGFILFHEPLEQLFSSIFVSYGLKYIQSRWYNDVIFLSITFATLIFVLSKFRRYVPSLKLYSFFVLAVAVYLFYRLFDSPWNWTAFSFSRSIRYADTFPFVFIIASLLILPTKKVGKRSENSFFDDESLGIHRQDELGYLSYANSLAKKIISCHFNKAFAIGINGKWGLGKTSFIDLLKREITTCEEKIIQIDFNPWRSSSSKALIHDFFEAIQEKIKPYHSFASRLLVLYSNKLVSLHSNTISQSIQASISAITGFESINSLFKEINDALKKVNMKIVVYIDDLDRLDKKEIVEVIRLIRNTANFYNTFFVVAYDRNYILKALEQHNEYNNEQFLEKIFQIEITLPYFNKNIFRTKLVSKLKTKFPEEYHDAIRQHLIGSLTQVPIYVNSWIENMRDVTRLSNSLILNLYPVLGEVDIGDFIKLELLRLKYPSVYELLFNRTEEFLQTSDQKNNIYNYHLKNLDEKLATENDKGIKTQIEFYLSKNASSLSVPEGEVKRIISLITEIFDGTYLYSYSIRSHLSVIYPSKFKRYFAYSLLEGNLSEIEFSKARSQNQNDFNTKISEWVQKGLMQEVASRFEQIKSFDNREDFEKIIKAIFHFASIRSNTHNHYWFEDIVGYNGRDLIDKLNNYDNALTRKYYNDAPKEELQMFVRALFSQSVEPYIFESLLLRDINSQFTDNSFPLEKEETRHIVVGYLEKYAAKQTKLDKNIWRLYHSCKYNAHVPIGNSAYRTQEIIIQKGKEIMKEFVTNRDLNEYLFQLIAPETFNQKLFAVSNSVIELFENWTSFKKMLYEQDEDKVKYLKEFKDFFNVFESNEYSKYVPFQFKIIPIDDKIRKN